MDTRQWDVENYSIATIPPESQIFAVEKGVLCRGISQRNNFNVFGGET